MRSCAVVTYILLASAFSGVSLAADVKGSLKLDKRSPITCTGNEDCFAYSPGTFQTNCVTCNAGVCECVNPTFGTIDDSHKCECDDENIFYNSDQNPVCLQSGQCVANWIGFGCDPDFPTGCSSPDENGIGTCSPNPTTAIPTTAIPTTAVPTTAVPTTAVPTTAVPTTAVPTTAIPTTAVPTTAVPTTAIPTTAVPTTAIPTTGVPTTGTPCVPSDSITAYCNACAAPCQNSGTCVDTVNGAKCDCNPAFEGDQCQNVAVNVFVDITADGFPANEKDIPPNGDFAFRNSDTVAHRLVFTIDSVPYDITLQPGEISQVFDIGDEDITVTLDPVLAGRQPGKKGTSSHEYISTFILRIKEQGGKSKSPRGKFFERPVENNKVEQAQHGSRTPTWLIVSFGGMVALFAAFMVSRTQRRRGYQQLP